MALTEGLLLALVSMFCWGIADFIVVGPVRKIGNIKTLVIGQAVIFAAMISYVSLFPNNIHFTQQAVLLSFPPSALIILGFLALYRGIQVGKVSIVVPIVSSWSLVAVIIGFLVLRQTPTPHQIAGALLIVSGIILVSLKLSDLRSSIRKHKLKGVKEALLSMVFFGSALAFNKFVIEYVGWLSASFLFSLWQTLILAALFFVSKQGKTKTAGNYLLIAAAAGLLNWFGGLSYNLGISGEYLSVVSPVASASVFVTVILSFILLKERLTKPQYVGVFSVILGIIAIAV
ncbi:MAG: EamA family transporter [Candidatus Aenigmarchaeota archaeon]|nr:EamA family transporter [Candidatus Aenigmarchaeota archaeon]